MLEPLIQAPKNAKQRKEARKRLDAARAHYREVERLGGMIFALDTARAYLVEQQTCMADDLRRAGVRMEGAVWK